MMKKQHVKTEAVNVSDAGKTGFSVLLSRIMESPFLTFIFITLTGAIIYSNSFVCTFHLDDLRCIVDNEEIKSLSNIEKVFQLERSRFLPYLSFMINFHYGQLNVWGYHFVNLLIHLLSSILVWWIIRLIFATPAVSRTETAKYRSEIAFFAALLFVAHPLATQSVTYIVQRMASMVALFYLFSIGFYLRGRLYATNQPGRYLMFGLAILSAIMTFFCKENGYTVPFAIILTELCFFPSERKTTRNFNYGFILLSGLAALTIYYAVTTFSFSILKPKPPSHGNDFTITSTGYLMTQFSVILKYVQLLILPLQQNLDYDYPYSKGFFEPRTFASFIILLLILFYGFRSFKKHPIVSFSIFWFFLTLSIESSVIPIEDLIFEHRTYLPSFGFFLLLCYAPFGLFKIQNIRTICTAFLIVAFVFGVLAHERNKDWRDPITMWSDVVSKSPNKARPYGSLGDAYVEVGRMQDAVKAHLKATTINPQYAQGHFILGKTYSKMEQWERAYEAFSEAINVDQKYTNALMKRAVAAYKLERNQQALDDYNRVVELDEKNKLAWFGRASCKLRMNRYQEAVNDYNKSIELDPNFSEAYFMRSSTYIRMQDWERAIENLRKAVALKPDYKNAWLDLGVSLMALKRWSEALPVCTEGIQRYPDFAPNYLHRGICYANLNKWPEAIADYERTLKIAPTNALAIRNLELARRKSKMGIK